MAASAPSRVVYRFGPFRLDAADRVLWRGDLELPLTPKAAEILLVLLENSGHVVDKDVLLARVWPDSYVEESTLAQNILTLRKTLGKQADSGQEYIRTLPRRGYRFDTAVLKNGEAVGEKILAVAGKAQRAGWWRYAIVAVAVAALVFLTVVSVHFRSTGRATIRATRLVVLPFTNLSGDASQDYMSEGLTEEMITQLGALNPERLSVIARTSAMAYRNPGKNAREIGSELGVDYLLEGSVRRDHDRIRVSTQLIRASDQSNLWAANYDRELRDILTLETDVARSVATQIALSLPSAQVARLDEQRPLDPQVYELYLKARHFWNRRTPESISKAIELLQQAINQDPSYARAHVALADCYVLGPIYELRIMPRESLRLAEAEANRALELDPTLGEARAALAYALLYEWNFTASEAEFQKSIRLNPRYATAHQWYAEYLRFMNRQEEAIVESKYALEIDPLSPIINTEAALPYLYRGENDKAVAQLQRTIDLDPYFASAHGHLCEVYDLMGRYSEALQECLAAQTLGRSDWSDEQLNMVYMHLGRDKARLVKNVSDAQSYLVVGDKDRALAELERAWADREPTLIGIRVDPRLALLHGEPRFEAILRHMDFPN